MNPAILLYIGKLMQILDAAPALIAAGQNVWTTITQANSTLRTMIAENRGATDEEWKALDIKVAADARQLHDLASQAGGS